MKILAPCFLLVVLCASSFCDFQGFPPIGANHFCIYPAKHGCNTHNSDPAECNAHCQSVEFKVGGCYKTFMGSLSWDACCCGEKAKTS
ncbi:hypothetical protein AAVH_27494 [Aphelenchoides avenae]|nr:hypothetical protein AAVH_27494 [Aphelenchus avenae]